MHDDEYTRIHSQHPVGPAVSDIRCKVSTGLLVRRPYLTVARHVLAPQYNRLVGLVVKVSTSGAEDPGYESRLRRDFSGSSHTSDFKTGTPVAPLPGAWHYRVSAGTGRPGVSIL